MTKFKRLAYLGYYVKELDWGKFYLFTKYASQQTGRSKLSLWFGALLSSLRHNVSLLEYFQFGFYQISEAERLKWAGTGFMYEYQLYMNPKNMRNILDDKRQFFEYYKEFVSHGFFSLPDLQVGKPETSILWENDVIVVKKSNGKAANGIVFLKAVDYPRESLIRYMLDNGYNVAESYIQQHEEMNRLSPSGVNTVRIFTQLDINNEVVILGCRQRISLNSKVDNLAAGNVAAEIDERTGRIIGPGYFSDITKQPISVHPYTGEAIVGFQVPYWNQILQLVTKAALKHPQNRSIGWDVVVMDKGPSLIEGNHDWCKLVWQLPVQRGLKNELEKHLS